MVDEGATGESSAARQQQIDESLYSRQLYVLGEKAMHRIGSSHVLLCGCPGHGVEVAKCLVLGGVRALTIFDTKNLCARDLSANYYASSKDLGRNRADTVVSCLQELNSYVKVFSLSDASKLDVNRFDLVIVCAEDLQEAEVFVQECQRLDCKYILSISHGVFATMYNYFGQKFFVSDQDGQELQQSYIETLHVSQNQVTITCFDEKPHNLSNGDLVKIEELCDLLPFLYENEGNSAKSFEIQVITPFSFKFHCETNLQSDVSLTGRGIVHQCKVGKFLDFCRLDESFQQPDDIMISDFGKMSHPSQILSLYLSLRSEEVLQQFSWDIRRIKEFCVDFMNSKFNFSLENLDLDMVHHFVNQFGRGQLAPIASLIGSIVASEAMKALSGKFTPIRHWFCFDALQCIQDTHKYQSVSDDSSLEHQILGKETSEFLARAKVFMVGSGAIGCELLKLFALMNVSNQDGSFLKVTDMDQIEKSNLNRQFLFRPKDVGSSKSMVACNTARQINHGFRCEALTDQMSSEFDWKYNAEFYESLTLVVNALDNMETRLFMDSKCITFGLPLLESGTLGTKGNTQIVVPHLTESFGSSQDPVEEQIALCTIKNFPYQIQHTIAWAREFFESEYILPSLAISKFFDQSNGKLYLSELKENILNDKSTMQNTSNSQQQFEILCKFFLDKNLKCKIPRSFEDTVLLSMQMLHDQFINQILQLTATFPENHVSATGVPFWSGLKRFPSVLQINVENDEDQFDFIESSSYQLCEIFGLQFPNATAQSDEGRRQQILTTVSNFQPSKFEVNLSLKIAENDQQLKEQQEQHQNVQPSSLTSFERDRQIFEKLEQIQQDFRPTNSPNLIEFEKDDDRNRQMQLLTALSNLRASNYKIKRESRLNTKRIAGKIIPAINTTTALVASLVSLEFYKLAKIESVGEKEEKLSLLRNSYLNLALPFITQSEPMPAATLHFKDKHLKEHRFTLWDFLEVHSAAAEQPMTLRQFLHQFEQQFSIEVAMLSCAESLVYADFYSNLNNAERLDTPLIALIEKSQKTKFDRMRDKFVVLEVMMKEVDENEYDCPSVKFFF